jgi:CARDB/Calcineurin-like phosphoesterase
MNGGGENCGGHIAAMSITLPRTASIAAFIALLVLATAAAGDHRRRPDLSVTHLDGAPATIRAGDRFRVSYRVKNRGSRLASHTRAGFFLQRRHGGLTLRVRLGDRGVPALQAGHRASRTVHLRVPASLGQGRWRLIACADRTRRVRELREGDNCRRAKRATLVLPPESRPRPQPPAPVTLTSPATTVVGSRRPTVAGSADPRGPVTVLVYVGTSATGTPVQAFTLQPDANGAWSGAPPAALGESTYTVRARQGQGAALRMSAGRTFTVDVTAPPVTIDLPAHGATTDLRTLAGHAGPESLVGLSLYTGPTTVGGPIDVTEVEQHDGEWSSLLPPLTPGEYTVVAEQVDGVGNRGSDEVTFTVPVSLLAAGDIAACNSSGDEATAALLSLRVGTVALLGDNAYEDGSPSQYANCYGPSWGPFLDRTRPAAGNREYHTAGASGYFGYFGEAAGTPGEGYYSYDLGAWHVIALNTANNCSAATVTCGAGSPQEQWLRQDLAAHPAQCTLAYFHHPQFSSYLGTNAAVRPLWQALQDFGADVVLNGHAHNYERFAPQSPTGGLDSVNGIREFVVGTGGDSHHAFPSTFDAHSEVHDDTTFGVLDLTLRASGYSWRFVPAAGGAFSDAGTDNCH